MHRESLAITILAFLLFANHSAFLRAEENPSTPAQRAEKVFLEARSRFQSSTNAEAAIQFARASFDWAEFAFNNRQREMIAKEGIAASRRLVQREPRLAAAHYYLGMNLGQLARTKTIGALPIVDEMEDVFLRAQSLDPNFDFAGPVRNLGLLYLEAPSFSVGDKKKARQHLQRAVELAGDYPENRLNLIDAYLRWNERQLAQAEIEALEKIWPEARQKLTGKAWETSWADWEKRLAKIKSRLAGSAK